MTSRRVTVVIITRNRKAELLRTLAHMTTLPDRAPVMVVGNGSTDHTSEAVTAQFGQVTLLCSERNLGAPGRNLAVQDSSWRSRSDSRGLAGMSAEAPVFLLTRRPDVSTRSSGVAPDDKRPELPISLSCLYP